ncbi:MAG: hypothetical protein D9N14_01205 [Ketobacter sp.]|nr:MAG: hypothetical protein D9N14_01205 [Ketobacter sp.]
MPELLWKNSVARAALVLIQRNEIVSRLLLMDGLELANQTPSAMRIESQMLEKFRFRIGHQHHQRLKEIEGIHLATAC